MERKCHVKKPFAATRLRTPSAEVTLQQGCGSEDMFGPIQTRKGESSATDGDVVDHVPETPGSQLAKNMKGPSAEGLQNP